MLEHFQQAFEKFFNANGSYLCEALILSIL
jgi:hypothetical protein